MSRRQGGGGHWRRRWRQRRRRSWRAGGASRRWSDTITTLLPSSATPREAQAAAAVPAQRDRPGGMHSGLTVMAEGRLRVRLYRYMVFSPLQTGLPTRPPFRAGLPSPAATAGCVQTAQQVAIPVMKPMLGAAGPQSAHIAIFLAVERSAAFNRRIGPAWHCPRSNSGNSHQHPRLQP